MTSIITILFHPARTALELIQRNIRKYLSTKNWCWWHLWVKVKPLLSAVHAEDEMKQKEEELKKTAEEFEKTKERAKELETMCNQLTNKNNDMAIELSAAQETLEEAKEEIELLIEAKVK